MTWLEQHLQQVPAPETIIHLGAGACTELSCWHQTGARRIVLVEADADLFSELNDHADQHDNIELVKAAVAGQSGPASLHLFNFPRFNSLRQATNLHKALPGIKLITRVPVETVAIDSLLSQLNLDSRVEHWLVIDTPGEEASILEGLEEAERLHDFARIFLTAGSEALYEDAWPASELIQKLGAFGFHPIGPADQSDADWPRFHLHLDRAALKCQRIEQQLAECRQAISDRETECQALQSELKHSKDLLTAQEQTHTQRLDEAREALEELKRNHAGEMAALHEQQSHAARESRSRIETLESELSSKQESIEQQAAELKSLEDRLDEESRHKASVDSELTAAHDEIRRLTEKLEKSNADLSLALRLQTLRENDLKELQARYRETVKAKEDQQDLLVQLHHRLSRAAEILKLSQTDDQELPEQLLEALSGTDDRAK